MRGLGVEVFDEAKLDVARDAMNGKISIKDDVIRDASPLSISKRDDRQIAN